MTAVVFTGPAVNAHGQTILRDNLIKACSQIEGLEVHSSVRRGTSILVASREDTVKARSARERGLIVMSYPQFLATFLRGTAIPMGGPYNAYTDILPNPHPHHSRDNVQLELLDQL